MIKNTQKLAEVPKKSTEVLTKPSKVYTTLASIDKFFTKTIPDNSEVKKAGLDMVSWGSDNHYPDYLKGLSEDVGLLRSIISGCTDIALGNSLEGIDIVLAKRLTLDWFTYGGMAIQVICDKLGRIGSVNYINFRKLRSNEDNTRFFYSDDWSKSCGRVKYLEYPSYVPGNSGIVYVKANYDSTYPVPCYGAKTTLQCCELEKEITNYHVASIQNGFSGGLLFNFQNGIPDDQQKAEIERNIMEKFCGSGNAGRVLINFSDDPDHSLSLDQVSSEDYGEKYLNLQSKVQQEIFTAFRATPNLLGIKSDSTGFNTEEYDSCFKLFSRMIIKPYQNILKSTFSSLGYQIDITPYSLD